MSTFVQALEMMAIPATFFLLCRYLNLRGDGTPVPPSSAPDPAATTDYGQRSRTINACSILRLHRPVAVGVAACSSAPTSQAREPGRTATADAALDTVIRAASLADVLVRTDLP